MSYVNIKNHFDVHILCSRPSTGKRNMPKIDIQNGENFTSDTYITSRRSIGDGIVMPSRMRSEGLLISIVSDKGDLQSGDVETRRTRQMLLMGWNRGVPQPSIVPQAMMKRLLTNRKITERPNGTFHNKVAVGYQTSPLLLAPFFVRRKGLAATNSHPFDFRRTAITIDIT